MSLRLQKNYKKTANTNSIESMINLALS